MGARISLSGDIAWVIFCGFAENLQLKIDCGSVCAKEDVCANGL